LLVWAASGVVMMYVSFPQLTTAERVAGLPTLRFGHCCSQSLHGAPLQVAAVEMLDDRPVLRLTNADAVDLDTGATIPNIDADAALRIAMTHWRQSAGAIVPARVDTIVHDQWTVAGRFDSHRPIHKVMADSATGDVLYVSGRTGEVIQDTIARERFWNWLGAIPHWLYFAAVRQHARIWSRIVVWTSVAGTALALTGLYVGWRQFRRGARWSPYRGIERIHHLTGLVFGILTVSWVFSGLASMNPWGWFEASSAQPETRRLAGGLLTDDDVDAFVKLLTSTPLPDDVRRAELIRQAGSTAIVLIDRLGNRKRFSSRDLTPVPVNADDLASLAGRLRTDSAVASAEILAAGDTYYFNHHEAVVLPVYRVIFSDAERTRYYLHPTTGELLAKVDAGARHYRWFHLALHRLDFLAPMRARPLWDLLVLPLLLGVALLCAIGVCLLGRRLIRR
jgi:hypothetical protein